MNVTFEEQGPIMRSTTPAVRGITGWLVRNRIVSTVSHAQTVLLVGAILILAVTVMIGRSALSQDTVDTGKGFKEAVVR